MKNYQFSIWCRRYSNSRPFNHDYPTTTSRRGFLALKWVQWSVSSPFGNAFSFNLSINFSIQKCFKLNTINVFWKENVQTYHQIWCKNLFFIPVIDLSRFSSIVYLQLSDVARLLLLLLLLLLRLWIESSLMEFSGDDNHQRLARSENYPTVFILCQTEKVTFFEIPQLQLDWREIGKNCENSWLSSPSNGEFRSNEKIA